MRHIIGMGKEQEDQHRTEDQHSRYPFDTSSIGEEIQLRRKASLDQVRTQSDDTNQ
jgi:hypothetical protein